MTQDWKTTQSRPMEPAGKQMLTFEIFLSECCKAQRNSLSGRSPFCWYQAFYTYTSICSTQAWSSTPPSYCSDWRQEPMSPDGRNSSSASHLWPLVVLLERLPHQCLKPMCLPPLSNLLLLMLFTSASLIWSKSSLQRVLTHAGVAIIWPQAPLSQHPHAICFGNSFPLFSPPREMWCSPCCWPCRRSTLGSRCRWYVLL